MDVIQIIYTIIGSIVSTGILLAGAGYGYAQFKKGSKSLVQEDLDVYIKQLEAMRKISDDQTDQIKVLQADIKVHTGEIGRLNGIIEEKERKIKELTEMLANRDPALGEYIQFSRNAIAGFQDSIKRVHDRLDAIDGKFNQILSEGKVT
jgi:chromosome segregation ATPase